MTSNKTIKTLLRYKLTRTQRITLYMLEHINGCGGKGGTSFDDILDFIQSLNYFDPKKFMKFKNDLKKLCEEHDIDFARGGGIFSFWKANKIFVKKIDELTHWIEDKDKQKKEYALKGLKYSLNIFGLKYFNWSFRKESFESLFTNTKHVCKN